MIFEYSHQFIRATFSVESVSLGPMIKRLWETLLKRNENVEAQEYPRSMLDLRGGDPCWCGSAKKYRKCHRPEDRKRGKELLGAGLAGLVAYRRKAKK